MNLSQIDLNRLTHHPVDGFLLLLVCIFCTADQLLVEICVVLYVTHLSIVFQSHLSFPPLGVHSMSKFHSWGPKDVVYKIFIPIIGKVSAQLHTIVKQICLPNGNLLFLSLFSLSKN